MSSELQPAQLGGRFVFGVATSAYQVEGAVDTDGRRPSIWDTFADTPGNIEDGSTGAVACDHYHRWREDIEHMRWMGLDAYRFSTAWPRIVPDESGTISKRGLAFYDRLVDGLLEANIRPFVTLYHWDLPQWLEDRGGWRNRDTVHAFLDYTEAVVRRLGDRVQDWVTQNEPWCAAILGHWEGAHAPGMKSPRDALAVAHHLLLSHGLAVPIIRSEAGPARVGLAHMYLHCEAASDSEADADATRRLDGTFNRWYLDPLYGRGYPIDILEHYGALGYLDPADPEFVNDGDLEAIAAQTDFLGINYYTRGVIRSDAIEESKNRPRIIHTAPAEERTDMGWEVYPDGLEQALSRLHRDYAPDEICITENGAAYATGPDAAGRVPDERRIRYFDQHLARVARARDAGVPVTGYFAWSLMDNFEWAYGYTKRFGLLYVDPDTKARVPKDSAHWYRNTIAQSRGRRCA